MKPKIYIRDFNGVLAPVKEKFDLTEEPREADAFVLWQDIRGDMLELCKINQEYMKKPVVVVQHGRGATNDYLPPNKFPMLADKYCCWGTKEKERLDRAGYGDRAVITGSPLVSYLKPKEPHDGKNIVFVPVITSHEEPDNVITYWELKKIELSKASGVLKKNYDNLRQDWHSWLVESTSGTENSIPYHVLNKDWRLIAKITSVHDKKLYLGDVVPTVQINKTHITDCIHLISLVDCVVGLEEGTFQLLAMAMGVPCVMVDGFKYREYGGVDYSSVEMIKTDGARRVELAKLEETIDEQLANPDSLKSQREQIVKDEFWDGVSDPIENIVNVVKGVLNG
jgi:hypothetical protein